MYVKLAFSVAAHLDSEIMIMDEVLAVGDMAFQKKCLDKMRDAAKKEGRTVLYVSHNMNTIRQLCDRCVVLDKGKVVFEGGVEESINHYMNTTKALAVVNECPGERRGIPADHQVHIDCVTFIDTDFPLYQSGDTVCVRVDYTCKHNISNLAFRMTVQSGDKTVVGLATSKPCIESVEGLNETKLTLALDWLAPGKYIIKLTAYSVNDFGLNQMHDIVDDCFAFEKIQSMDDNNRMSWNHSWWGYMMFPELEVG
jgi:lipopolysaccharide transport system ATP-binding protein